jgi:hypothetical protein
MELVMVGEKMDFQKSVAVGRIADKWRMYQG